MTDEQREAWHAAYDDINVDYWKKQQGKQDCESLLQEFIIAERELQQAIAHLQSVEPAAQPPTQQGSEPAEICPNYTNGEACVIICGKDCGDKPCILWPGKLLPC